MLAADKKKSQGKPDSKDNDKPVGTRIQRQISRMIQHLRDQYKVKKPLNSMPSNWLIEELVVNAAKSYILKCDNWQLRVTKTLEQIIRDTSYKDCLYINSRNNLPLFPNNDLFGSKQVNVAMKELIRFLEDIEEEEELKLG
jgi:hypothetical protein